MSRLADVEAGARFTDEELTVLALAGDPDVAADEHAVSLADLLGTADDALLPEWYMPPPMGGARLRGWRRPVAFLLVLSFLLITTYGLCSTYGHVVPA